MAVYIVYAEHPRLASSNKVFIKVGFTKNFAKRHKQLNRGRRCDVRSVTQCKDFEPGNCLLDTQGQYYCYGPCLGLVDSWVEFALWSNGTLQDEGRLKKFLSQKFKACKIARYRSGNTKQVVVDTYFVSLLGATSNYQDYRLDCLLRGNGETEVYCLSRSQIGSCLGEINAFNFHGNIDERVTF